MNIADYRKSFAEYNSAIYLSQYRHRAGLDPELRMRDIYDRYGELFSPSAIAELKQAAKDIPESRITGRSALHSLCGSAAIGYLEMNALELTEECARHDAARQIEWNGLLIPAYSAPKLMALETQPAKRRELAGLWSKAMGSSNDLRAARMNSLYDSVQALGSASYKDFFSDLSGTNFSELLSLTTSFLERTESAFETGLARATARHLPGVAKGHLDHADFFYFQRMSWLDRSFTGRELMTTYSKAMNGFGIRAETQRNIHVDDEVRAFKNPRAGCFPVNPPRDVRLMVAPIGGVYDYTTLFHEAGHAQHFAWTSEDLAASHPEFVYSSDYATTEGYAFLLQHLFLDSSWLRENFGCLNESDAGEIVSDLSLIVMLAVRRYCAKLKFELALHNSADLRSEQLMADYAIAQEQATGFQRSPSGYLWDVDDGFYSAAYLRAWAFGASLREYLRTRHGRRWWAAPRAGDELIDLWNTGSQYSVEELSRLIGFGDINFDLLADVLIAGVNNE